MGGCSSRPKTAEFEGALEVEEDKPLTEAPWKSSEAVNVGLKGIGKEQEPLFGLSTHAPATQREQDDVREAVTEMTETHDKRMIAGFSPKGGSFQEERHVLEDASQHVKRILSETVVHPGAPTLEEEFIRNPEVIVSKLHKDPVFNMQVIKTIQKAPICSEIEAESAHAQPGGVAVSDEALEDHKKDVFSESESTSGKDVCFSCMEISSKRKVTTMGLHDGVSEVTDSLSARQKEVLDLQKESSFNAAVGLREDALDEARSKGLGKGMVALGCDDAVSKSAEQRLDGSVSHTGQEFGEGSKECGELGKESEARVCEVVNVPRSAVSTPESWEDVLKDSRRPRWENGIKGSASDEAAEKVITGSCIIRTGPFPGASDQELSRLNDSIDAVHPDIAADVCAITLQHVRGEQEVNGVATLKVAMKDLKLQAEDHHRTGSIVTKSKAEILDTTHGDGEPPSPNSSMNDKLSLPVSAQENRLGKVHGDKIHAAEVQPKADASCASGQLTACQVIITRKPESQSVHVKDSAKLALISAQDIPAFDIDEVLEKLASEFERQESLARATS